MDNNNIKVELQKEDLGNPTVPMKKCKCCGELLPVENFAKYGTGHRAICEKCRRDKSGVTDRFKDFTSRELIAELKSRGYRGNLTRIVTETIKL